jgi:hypothetical protein
MLHLPQLYRPADHLLPAALSVDTNITTQLWSSNIFFENFLIQLFSDSDLVVHAQGPLDVGEGDVSR